MLKLNTNLFGNQRIIAALIAAIFSNQSHADCSATGPASFNCSGESAVNVPLTGNFTLDNAAGDTTFNNTANNKIVNDRTLDNGGDMNLLQTNGSNSVLINNRGKLDAGRGVVYATDADGNTLYDGTGAQLYDLVPEQVFNLDGTPFLVNGHIVFQDVVVYRLNPDGSIQTDGTGLPIEQAPAFLIDPTAFTNDGAGRLLYNGAPAGLATAINTGNGSSVVINNLLGPKLNNYFPPDYYAFITTGGDFSSAIFGNAANVVINNQALISNNSFSGTIGDTITEGHWAIANYGAGNTVLNLVSPGDQSYVNGDILFVDRNPLLETAQKLNPALVLQYDTANVGIRNSTIKLAQDGTLGAAMVNGNIYLGAGEHLIDVGIAGKINGNIYVDQKDAVITDAAGNEIGSIAGAKKFTLNSRGGLSGNEIRVNDVVGSVNNINITLGSSDGVNNPGAFFTPSLFFNGLGTNNFTINCAAYNGGGGGDCGLSGSTSGLTNLTFTGSRFSDGDPAKVYSAETINISAQQFRFIGNLLSPAVTIAAGSIFSGNFYPDFSGPPPGQSIPPDEIGSITGNLENNGNVDVRGATMTINGNANFNPGSNLSLRISELGNGQVAVSGVGSFSNNSSVTPTVKNKFISDGDNFTISSNTSGNPIINNATGVVQFTSDDSTGDLRLIAKIAVPKNINATEGGVNAVNALMDYRGDSIGLNALALEVQTLDALELKRAAERLRPESHDGSVRLVQGNVDQIFGMVDSHLFENQINGDSKTLIVSPGDKKVSGAGIWAQGFGGGGRQDLRNNTDGYSLKSSGFAVGADRLLGNNQDLRLGVLAAYSRGNVDNLGYTDNSRVDINAYTAGLYGAQSFGDWYLNGATAASLNRYTSKRVALGQASDGSHDSWQYSAKVDAGLPIQLADNFTLIPIASLNYQHVSESGYTESGSSLKSTGAISPYSQGVQTIPSVSSATRLKIGNRSFDSIRSGLGAKTLFNVQEKDWNAGLELSAMLTHEFGDLAQDATARFVAGGESFYSPGVELARNTVVLGSRARLTGDDDKNQITLLASYDAEFREKYFGQSLSMQLRYDFDQASAYIERANTRKEAMKRNSVPTQLVTATEQDIADITKAMQASSQKIVEPLSLENQQRLAISKVLNYWINALTSKNLENYFNVYASDFVISEGGTRQQWERKRKLEILKSDRPVISIVNLNIKPNGNQASAYFTLAMQDGQSKQAVLKSIDFVKKGERWLIASEDGITMTE